MTFGSSAATPAIIPKEPARLTGRGLCGSSFPAGMACTGTLRAVPKLFAPIPTRAGSARRRPSVNVCAGVPSVKRRKALRSEQTNKTAKPCRQGFAVLLVQPYLNHAPLPEPQAFLRAGGGADTAADAGFRVKFPALGRTVHRDRALGTFFCAERAVNAGGGVINRLAADFARLRCGRRGAGEGLAALLGTGGGVARHNRQALFGADIGTVAALYAVEPVDGPGACRAVHSQRARRAAARA